jgi:transcriptional regulator with XRE-family HTH domain
MDRHGAPVPLGEVQPQITDPAVGVQLRAARREAKLSQVALAARAGVSLPTLALAEKGLLTIRTAGLLAAALALPVERLTAPGAAEADRRCLDAIRAVVDQPFLTEPAKLTTIRDLVRSRAVA